MRVSEERYARDRRALDVAKRMIEFEARTKCIRRLTGLADGRIRSLAKSCTAGGGTLAPLRHRGKSPQNVRPIVGRPRLKEEASALLGLCRMMGIGPLPRSTRPAPANLTRAERLCDAYWTYRQLVPTTNLSFEQMLLLVEALAEDGDLRLRTCRGCQAIVVGDAGLWQPLACPQCEAEDASVWEESAMPRYRVAEGRPEY